LWKQNLLWVLQFCQILKFLTILGQKENVQLIRRVWRHQRGNQNPSIKEGQTTQWPKKRTQTTIYKTQHRKLQIEQHEPHLSPALKSGAPEGLTNIFVTLTYPIFRGRHGSDRMAVGFITTYAISAYHH
jgi:hypothetical protein